MTKCRASRAVEIDESIWILELPAAVARKRVDRRASPTECELTTDWRVHFVDVANKDRRAIIPGLLLLYGRNSEARIAK